MNVPIETDEIVVEREHIEPWWLTDIKGLADKKIRMKLIIYLKLPWGCNINEIELVCYVDSENF